MACSRLPAAALAAMAALLGVVVAAPASAQQPVSLELPNAQAYGDETLQSFSMAGLDSQQVLQDYSAEIQQSQIKAERLQHIEETDPTRVYAVATAPGNSIAEYNEIIQASNGDSEVSDRINRYMQSVTQ